MTARLLDGKRIAEEIRNEVAQEASRFVAGGGEKPTLAAILVGEDPASQVYVRNKERACEKAGLGSKMFRLEADSSQSKLLDLISSLNTDSTINGILVQLPLPRNGNQGKGFDEREVLDAVDPFKDVDCFSPVNVGLLMQGRPRFLPCTPHGSVVIAVRTRGSRKACCCCWTQRHRRQADGDDACSKGWNLWC
jgi:methylenetetrahydrofolate dehydrogenase (NADP+) / methenyltetrahydrofolate cyclohydrolase